MVKMKGNNDILDATQKTKDRATRTSLKPEVKPGGTWTPTSYTHFKGGGGGVTMTNTSKKLNIWYGSKKWSVEKRIRVCFEAK